MVWFNPCSRQVPIVPESIYSDETRKLGRDTAAPRHRLRRSSDFDRDENHEKAMQNALSRAIISALMMVSLKSLLELRALLDDLQSQCPRDEARLSVETAKPAMALTQTPPLRERGPLSAKMPRNNSSSDQSACGRTDNPLTQDSPSSNVVFSTTWSGGAG